jgi:site-specific DNA-methyltransferase (adenine-specific)
VLSGQAPYCVLQADCRTALLELPDGSADSVVTDPPYGQHFLRHVWDGSEVVFAPATWIQPLRVAKPGSYLMAFATPRRVHRLARAIEDVGWVIIDQLAWLSAMGFPKVGCIRRRDGTPVVPGWGGSLKPAMELICLAQKPCEGTVAQNLEKHGTGALHIDACRVPLPPADPLHQGVKHKAHKLDTAGQGWGFSALDRQPGLGRWPANVLHDGSQEVMDILAGYGVTKSFFQGCPLDRDDAQYARIYFGGKVSRRDREEGLKALPGSVRRNHHPTVKPTALMRYLARLITPRGGIILDPFAGSGSTGKAALLEGFRFIGIEQDVRYAAIARARIEHAARTAAASAREVAHV